MLLGEFLHLLQELLLDGGRFQHQPEAGRHLVRWPVGAERWHDVKDRHQRQASRGFYPGTQSTSSERPEMATICSSSISAPRGRWGISTLIGLMFRFLQINNWILSPVTFTENTSENIHPTNCVKQKQQRERPIDGSGRSDKLWPII